MLKEKSPMKRLSYLALVLAALTGLANSSRAVDFHVATAQDLQNALTVAAANGANNNIWLTNGYYTGTFNYNSTASYSLALLAETNLNNAQVTIDGAAGGRDMNLTCSGSSGNMTVSNLTFVRNCGIYQIGALRLAAASGGNITVSGCRFLSLTNSLGMGLEIAAGQNTTIFNCTVIGKTNNASGGNFYDGDGIKISGVTGNTFIYNSTMAGNYVGWGANITASAVLTVSNNVIQGNYYGGMNFQPSVGSQLAQVLVTGNVVAGNGSSGGAYLYNFNTLNLTGNIFTGNTGNSGASVNYGVTATATGNTFIGNVGGYYGGGASFGSVTTALIAGNTFSGNNAAYYGGGAYISSITTATVTGNIFSGNTSANYGGGGASFASDQYLILSNNTFSANQCQNSGWGGGVYINNSANALATVNGNTFTGNSSSGNYGGGALCVNGCTNVITGNTFLKNSAANGGGAIYDTAPVITLTDNLLANNTQAGAAATGGGIFVNASTALYLINNTIFGNTSGGGGGGAAFQVNGLVEVLNVYNNIIWGNSAVGSGADVYLTGSGQSKKFLYNDVNGMYGVWDITQNLINLDPQFFDPVNGDYHFPGTSPCANVGTNGVPAQPLTDLDGNNRTNTLGQIDLGCYEFNTTATHPADTNANFVITAAEYAAYAAAWKAGQTWTNQPNPGPNPISANYVTRAGYLMTNNSGSYHNDGSARPVNWKTGP